jgi:hypothetical protein
MSTAQVYEHYEQYVREYRSVLHLVDQILAPRGMDAAGAAQARRHLLGEDAVAAFVHITERMQAQVSGGLMEVDVVLAALVYECCEKLTLLGKGGSDDEPDDADGSPRGERLLLPAERLFRGACQRLLRRGA